MANLFNGIPGHNLEWWLGLSLGGLIVGIVSGMFGVGGGFILTPMLAIVFGVPLPVAVGTGICQMCGASLAALLRYRKLGYGELKIDWMMMAGGVLGVGLGAQTVTALSRLGGFTLRPGVVLPWAKLGISGVYFVLLGIIGIAMLKDARHPSLPPGVQKPPGPLARLRLPPTTRLPSANQTVSIPLIGYLGLVLGFLSGLLGIGGGVVLMPILIYGIGMRVRMAAGTGILVLMVTSLAGTVSHARAGNVHLGMAMMLLMGSSIGAQIGATLTARSPGQKLRGMFAYIVLLTALVVAWDLLRPLFS